MKLLFSITDIDLINNKIKKLILTLLFCIGCVQQSAAQYEVCLHETFTSDDCSSEQQCQ